VAAISVKDLGNGKYKIRWRELVADQDGAVERGSDGRLKRRDRAKTANGKAERDQTLDRIRRALLDEGEYQPPAATEEATTANLERASLAWIEWKKTRCKPSSVVAYAGHMKRFFELVRELRGIREDEVVRAPELSRDLVIECIRRWQEMGRSKAWVYSAGRSVLDMWRWVSDDPEQFPGLPVPPREPKRVLPRVPVYVAPPAPTVAEMDACLRHIGRRGRMTRRVGVFLRFTGLRISQVLALRRRDLDLKTRALVVTVGKSEIEEAERRTIPLSRHLVAEVRDWVEEREPDDLLFPCRADPTRQASRKVEPLKRAWKAAQEAGETREAVWNPPNRRLSRPEHAFRAGLQAFLRKERVGEEVIDAIVGHGGRSVRTRHYAGVESLWDRMVEAVDKLPPIDWGEPRGAKVVRLETA
jgi:integrase